MDTQSEQNQNPAGGDSERRDLPVLPVTAHVTFQGAGSSSKPLTGTSYSSIPSEGEKLRMTTSTLSSQHLDGQKLSRAAKRKLRKQRNAQKCAKSNVSPGYSGVPSAQLSGAAKIKLNRLQYTQCYVQSNVSPQYPCIPNMTSACSGTTKMPKQIPQIPPSTERRLSKKARKKAERRKKVERNTLPKCKMAVIREDFPDGKLTEEDVKHIQAEILNRVDKSPAGEALPLFKHFFLTYRGILIYQCGDLQTCQWLGRALNKYSVGDGTLLKVIEAKDIPRSEKIKVAFKTGDVATEDADKLLARVKALNPALKVENWRLLQRTTNDSGQRLILSVDRESYNVIQMANYRAYTGVDQGFFTTLKDPRAKPNKSTEAETGNSQLLYKDSSSEKEENADQSLVSEETEMRLLSESN